MKSLIFVGLAAGSASLSSLFFRKNSDDVIASSNPNGYLILFYFSAFIFSFLLFPDIWSSKINLITLGIGGSVGVLSSLLMFLTSRALKRGPSGLTFAFQNASAIFPGLIFFLLLGSDFGFSCSYFQLFGMILVLLGLFMGTRKEFSSESKISSKWLKYALAGFIVQIMALVLIQGRCILFDCNDASGFFSDFTISETDDIWFMPGQFGASFLLQASLWLCSRRKLLKSEVMFGSLGGIANFSSTCFLLLATKYALPFEKGILFPSFAVASMIICNLWSMRLYQEKFDFKSNVLCAFGIFIAVS